jgi:hypothetical protein
VKRRRRACSGGAAFLSLQRSYCFGQCLADVVFDEDELDEDDVDDFDEGELEAAWAMAVPPPMSAPDNARAVRPLLTR